MISEGGKWMGEKKDEYTFKFKKYVIDCVVPFPEILKRAGIEADYLGSVFCPFHEDSSHPSAKIYKDNDRDSLWCFAERKMYHSSDVILEDILDADFNSVFNNIWNKISEGRKNQLLELFGEEKNFLPENWTENEEVLNKFKLGEISYLDFLNLLVKVLVKE